MASSEHNRTNIILSKVPQVTMFFWIIKVLCATVGETFSDFMNVNLGLGLTNTTILMGIAFIIVLFLQFKKDKYVGYFGIASMKSTMAEWDGWLRRRLRMYIWKQWKKPKTRVMNLKKLGMPDWQAYRNGNTRKGYWAVAGSGILTHTITNKRLAQAGYYSILGRYESLHLCG